MKVIRKLLVLVIVVALLFFVGMKIADVINSCKEKYQNSQITEIAIAVYYNEADLQKLINDTISIKRLIGSDGILLKKLVKLGINPAGPEYKYQSFKETGVDAIYHWNRAFDFKTGECRYKDYCF